MARPWSLTPRRIAILCLSVTAAALPLYVVRWHYGPLPTTLLETLVGVTVIAYLLTLWSEKRLPQARTPFDVLVALLLVAGAVSVIDAPSVVTALGIYRAYFIEAVACFYIAVDLLRSRRDVTTFLFIAGAGSVAMAFGQIVSFLYAVAHHSLDLSSAPSFLNTSANDDAMYLEAPFAFSLAFVLFAENLRERAFAVVVLAVVGVGLLVSFSRGSYFAVVVLAFVFVLSLQSPRRRLWAIGGVALLGLVLVEIPYVNRRFLTLADSVSNRENLYKEAIQMLSHRPIFGAGISGFPVRVAPYRPAGSVIHIYPHDFWLTTWSELGLLGVVVFAALVVYVLWRSARALHGATGLERPLLWGAIGALTLFVGHGLFDSPYWKNDLSLEFWFVVALAIAGMRRLVPTSPADRDVSARATPTRT